MQNGIPEEIIIVWKPDGPDDDIIIDGSELYDKVWDKLEQQESDHVFDAQRYLNYEAKTMADRLKFGINPIIKIPVHPKIKVEGNTITVPKEFYEEIIPEELYKSPGEKE